MSELLYTFTEDERRLVVNAYGKFLQTLQFIAELHRLPGQVMVSPDLSGFIAVPETGGANEPKGKGQDEDRSSSEKV